jgi:hypothetical protein
MKIPRFSVFAASVFFGLCTLRLPAADPWNSSSILGHVARAYGNVTAYQDSGVVLIHDPRKEQPDEIHFQMLYLRPDRLRFDWVRHHPYPPLRHIKTLSSIRPDSQGAHLSQLGDSKPKTVTLNLAVAGATGVSRGSAHHIPRLLTPTITGFSLLDLADVTLLGEEVFEGVRCYRLEGRHPRGGVYELYIGMDDYFIRRIARENAGTSFTEEIHRNIRINGDVVPLPTNDPGGEQDR